MGRGAPLEGVARLGAAIAVAVGAITILYAVLGLQMYSTSQIHVCGALGCYYIDYPITQVPLLILGTLCITYAIPLWSGRKWGGSLGVCVSIATAFYTTLFPPLVPAPSLVDVGSLIVGGALASALCVAVSWRDLA